MGLHEEIRNYVLREIIEPAQVAGISEVSIRAGDVHGSMGLTNRHPAVCCVLDSRVFHRVAGVKLVSREGPDHGADVHFTFSVKCKLTPTTGSVRTGNSDPNLCCELAQLNARGGGASISVITCAADTERGIATRDPEQVGPAEMTDLGSESKNDCFRRMYAEGKTIGEIAKETRSIYQFVYSVISRTEEYRNRNRAAGLRETTAPRRGNTGPVPFTRENVYAAAALHSRLRQWSNADAVLAAARERFPDFDPVSCLAKAALLNSLYGTNVYSIVRMSDHIADVMALVQPGASQMPAELVEQLAMLPGDRGSESRMHTSFASKFAHFFVDPDRYPIYDKYAVRTIALHERNRRTATGRPYSEFVAAVDCLRSESKLSASYRDIDRYLWLTGLYLEWVNKADAKINVEVRKLFERDDPDIRSALQVMVPSAFLVSEK